MKCEYCISTTSNCSGSKQVCSGRNAVCMTLITEITASVKTPASMKRCSTMDDCKHYENLRGKILSGLPLNITDNFAGLLVGSVIKDVTCSKAPSSFASFFPAFLGCLLMKLLF
ncbi:putative Gamma type PLA2 inhibitor protein [Naja naja]|nr:putative Gamma type PLA2 inhibitor protein [Naja naja]